jgi:hypothetical protein
MGRAAAKKFPVLARGMLEREFAMKIKAVCAILAPVLAVGAPFFVPKLVQLRSAMIKPTHPMGAMAALAVGEKSSPGSAAETKGAPLAAAGSSSSSSDAIELQVGAEQGVLKAEFHGNGRETLQAKLTNTGTTPLKVQVEAGQMFDAALNAVVVVRPALIPIEPSQSVEVRLQTAATRTGNKIAQQNYRLSYGRVPKIDPLLTYAKEHSELTSGAIQTAVLALMENLPLNAVCKFTPLAGELKSRFNTDAFRVETADIIAGLQALRTIGVPDSSVVMTVDSQLKIEAMIEPLCRAAAMHYYNLTPDTEWTFWKNELLQGDPATRHYALYGIARFYPDIAMEMLPKWARETKTNAVFRLTAVQALADTQRPAALPVLRQLADELGLNTELGRAAAGAAEYLDQQLAALATKQASVSFRVAAKIDGL